MPRPQARPSQPSDDGIIAEVYDHDCYRVGDMRSDNRRILDIGAHIGSFACLIAERCPDAEIVCVEANGSNIEQLARNLPQNARLIHRCLCNQPPAAILSTVFPGSVNSGGSIVVADFPPEPPGPAYRVNPPPPDWGSLDSLIDELGWQWVDVLKLDCEGCEFDALENSRRLDSIGLIVGEWHSRDRFLRVVSRRFDPADWHFGILHDAGNLGTFWLSQRCCPQ